MKYNLRSAGFGNTQLGAKTTDSLSETVREYSLSSLYV